MKIRMTTSGIPRVERRIDRWKGVTGHTGYCTVEVGYATRYAIYVHEDLTMNHPRGGIAKFLVVPVWVYTNKYSQVMVTNIIKKRKNGMVWSLVKVAEEIRKDSRKLVPVDTGKLYRSAFVVVVSNHSVAPRGSP